MTENGAPKPGERLITLQLAARILGVSVRTVRRYIAYGYLDGYRVGPRALRVSAEQVRRFAHRLPDGDT